MKHLSVMLLVLAVLLTACGKNPVEPEIPEPSTPEITASEATVPEVAVPETTVPETTVPETTVPETTVPETTVPEVAIPETTVPETTVPETTQPEHTSLYIPGVSVEDVIVWFHEVCLDAEYIISGDPSRLQKWETPIFYMLHGEATQEDRAVLDAFAQWLNSVEGFPGISQTENTWEANLNIYFTDEQGFVEIMGSDYTNMDGAVTFWYDGADAIYQAVICIRTDIDQYLRNSVIQEELYNGLGPVQDTRLRSDSLIYQEYSQTQSMTQVDRLILQLLYHQDLRCGMNAQDCEAVIRNLYH